MSISKAWRPAGLLVLPLLLVAASGCDLALSDVRATETAEWRRTYALTPGGHVEIGNVNGRIQMQPSSDNTVEVVARKIAKAATQESARQALGRIEIQESASPSSIRIETKLQRGSTFFGGGGLEVQYTVRVPAGAGVKVTNVNGSVEIAGLSGRVRAENVNGGIKVLDVSGDLHASTVNGGVVAEFAQVPESGVHLECVNGGIKLRLPRDAKANLSARVMNGGIATNGLDVVTSGESSRRRLEGRLNVGGPKIELEGTNGGISIGAR